MKTVTLRTKEGIRIDISGKSYAQALRGYIRMMAFVKRAERTARLMELVCKLSSQCVLDWEAINQNLSCDHGTVFAQPDQQGAEQKPQQGPGPSDDTESI